MRIIPKGRVSTPTTISQHFVTPEPIVMIASTIATSNNNNLTFSGSTDDIKNSFFSNGHLTTYLFIGGSLLFICLLIFCMRCCSKRRLRIKAVYISYNNVPNVSSFFSNGNIRVPNIRCNNILVEAGISDSSNIAPIESDTTLETNNSERPPDETSQMPQIHLSSSIDSMDIKLDGVKAPSKHFMDFNQPIL